MKRINFICLGLFILGVGCKQPVKKQSAETKEEVSTLSETGLPRFGEDQLVVPGKQVGEIALGQNMDEVNKILGKAIDGDAAMGKAWSIWRIHNPKNPVDSGEISIYSTYKDSTMSSKVVKQIVVNTGYYATKNGMRNNADLGTVVLVMPSLKQAAIYVDEAKKDTLYVYDAIKEGLAFDVKKENHQFFTRSMTVHPKNQPVDNTYLTIHPGWKKIQ